MVLLDLGQVPHQPCDRVGLGVDAEHQLLGRQAVDDLVDTSRILPMASTSNSAAVIGVS
jgi:hypothetical protein